MHPHKSTPPDLPELFEHVTSSVRLVYGAWQYESGHSVKADFVDALEQSSSR